MGVALSIPDIQLDLVRGCVFTGSSVLELGAADAGRAGLNRTLKLWAAY
jgi:hypothetical protein